MSPNVSSLYSTPLRTGIDGLSIDPEARLAVLEALRLELFRLHVLYVISARMESPYTETDFYPRSNRGRSNRGYRAVVTSRRLRLQWQITGSRDIFTEIALTPRTPTASLRIPGIRRKLRVMDNVRPVHCIDGRHPIIQAQREVLVQ